MTQQMLERLAPAERLLPARPTGAITSVVAGHVHGWVQGVDPERTVALFVWRRRIATARPIAIAGRQQAEFTFDAKGCPPDLLMRPRLAIDVAVVGDPASRLASIEIDTATLLTLDDVSHPTQACSFDGCLDQISDGLLRGWVRDKARPERRVEIFVFAGARFIGRFIATGDRPDLAHVGHGDGRHGFAIPLQATEAASLTVIAGDPECWRIPTGTHAIAAGRTIRPTLPGTIEAFARALTDTEPFPKKTFVLDKLRRGAVPDAFSADYVALALECLRHEMVGQGETMKGSWRSRLRTWGEMRVLGARMRRLEELATAITQGGRLLEASRHRRNGC